MKGGRGRAPIPQRVLHELHVFSSDSFSDINAQNFREVENVFAIEHRSTFSVDQTAALEELA